MKKLLLTILVLLVPSSVSAAYQSSLIAPTPANGYVLQVSGTSPNFTNTWVATSSLGIIGGGGGTSGSMWATTTNGSGIYPNGGPTKSVVIGATATSSTDVNAKLEVHGATTIDSYTRVGSCVNPLIAYLPTQIADYCASVDLYANIGVANLSPGTHAAANFVWGNNASKLNDTFDGFRYYAYCGLSSSNYSDTSFGTLLAVPNAWTCENMDGPIQFALGTTSATVGYFQFITGNGVEATRITNTGAMGIGSTSPAARLTVTNPLSTKTMWLEDQVSDTSPIIADENGNFVIGTTTAFNASTKLTVANDTNVSRLQPGSLTMGGYENSNAFALYGYNLANSANTNLSNIPSSARINTGTAATGGFYIGATAVGAPMIFGTGGTAFSNERMRILGTGNVGIGTTTPGQLLSVAGDILGNNIIGSYFTATTTTASTFPYASTTSLTSSGSAFFASTGSVGIGTLSPTELLHVKKDQSAGTQVLLSNQSASSAAGANFQLQNNVGSFYFGAGSSNSTYQGGAYILTSANLPFSIWTSNAERFRVTGAGNVGIGTTTPLANLQVTTATADATTSIQLGKPNQNKGTCMTEYDTAGSPVYSFYAAGAVVKTVQNGGTAPSGCKN